MVCLFPKKRNLRLVDKSNMNLTRHQIPASVRTQCSTLGSAEPLQLQHCSSPVKFHFCQLALYTPPGTLKSFWIICVSTDHFEENIISHLLTPPSCYQSHYFVQSGANSQNRICGKPKEISTYLNSQKTRRRACF